MAHAHFFFFGDPRLSWKSEEGLDMRKGFLYPDTILNPAFNSSRKITYFYGNGRRTLGHIMQPPLRFLSIVLS
jgi:hypothetical protein